MLGNPMNLEVKVSEEMMRNGMKLEMADAVSR